LDNLIVRKSFEFALEIIALYRQLRDAKEYVISRQGQVLRSGTSIGANVEEAMAGQSRSDFLSKMTVASKEARETKYWLRLLQESQIVRIDVSRLLAQAEELIRILTSIVKTTSQTRTIQNSKLKIQNS
jgi:four helix bundle protein